MSFRKIMLTVAAATCVLAGVAQAQSVKDVIESRQANYKKTGANAQAIKKALDTGTDLKAVAVNAQEIADWATKIPTVFPVGSGPESGIKTAALATIWQDKPDFEKKAAGLHDAAMKLVVALNTGDKAAVAPAFQAMGGTCGACHQTYRAKQ